MRRDIALVLLIAAAAFFIRTYPAWNAVFGGAGVGFLETDAWYHVRLVENQVRNYPWRVTLDPYAAPGGQFVPIAPLFDTITSTAVVLVHGRNAGTAEVERLAAFIPPVLGTLTVIAVWALAAALFDRRAGLLAAALLAVLPGHFLDRTMLGFVDHHALEALLVASTLLALTRGTPKSSIRSGLAAGVGLGLYLLAWGSGAFFVAILCVWLVLCVPVLRRTEDLLAVASTTGVAAVVACVLVLAFQDSRMHRYGSQIVALVGLGGLSFAVAVTARVLHTVRRKAVVFAGLVLGVGVAAAVLMAASGGLFGQILVDVARLAPNPARMGVLEARPLFLYSGEWRWTQPWLFFRTGFFIGAIALVPFAMRVWRQRRAADLLMLAFTLSVFIATIGQNRFGYYLVTACAVMGGWLAVALLDWGGVPHAGAPTPVPRTRLPLAREAAVVAVAGGMFAPNIAPSLLLAERSSSFPAYWRDAMAWLRHDTPAPFQQATGRGDDVYYARYPSGPVPAPDYSVMNWWDQGYWISQSARRVPVSNPTQERALVSARFYAEIDPLRALALLAAEGSRFVLSDWELPFRKLADGTIMGRFQSVLDWAGGIHAQYYQILYRREGAGWSPVWVFHEPYYRSMAFRLSVLGGAPAAPDHESTVITVADRVDANGLQFRELLTERTYSTYAEAQEAAAQHPSAMVVGLDPWHPAFPVDAMPSLVEVHAARTPEQKPGESPWVRIFEVR
jgi:dolichyl-phosphooligosaccharide-protein glycotransferase